ncbi:AEC family transporter [Pelagicoccus sp. NFK12]|uniref:AEC family transporter n=1 Tax=Pelagicoccus enzymogenes TaxID=2773457 RepID=A0A927IH63_9BACT|nr:AEC family transporter [Pelagicoccus enzymogenes]MBD5779398.1 AEC family transporter [Pelagicoccus enzymogenes]MDQ8200579.1 AEC family transporter [Pelagicoccus enzymogenes]
MNDYLSILLLILPVFAMLGTGMFLRWKGWFEGTVEEGVTLLVVKVFYPCLIVSAMLKAEPFEARSGALWAPVIGFGTVTFGFLAASAIGRAFGYKKGSGLRTFAFSTGIYNYGYLPIPLMESMFGSNELAVLFVHNVGIEVGIWTVGISFLAGGSLRDGLRKIFNPMVVALAIGLAINMAGLAGELPSVLTRVINLLAGCAVPLGLLAIGSSLFDHIRSGEKLWEARDGILGTLLRLGLLPCLGLWIAWYFPLPIELKRVLVFQSAMPAGIMPILIAKHYGGQPMVAVRVVLATTAIGMLTMPLWIRFGLELIGS